MSRSLRINLDLTVPDNAGDFAVADFIFELLVNDQRVFLFDDIDSVDGTVPVRMS